MNTISLAISLRILVKLFFLKVSFLHRLFLQLLFFLFFYFLFCCLLVSCVLKAFYPVVWSGPNSKHRHTLIRIITGGFISKMAVYEGRVQELGLVERHRGPEATSPPSAPPVFFLASTLTQPTRSWGAWEAAVTHIWELPQAEGRAEEGCGGTDGEYLTQEPKC